LYENRLRQARSFAAGCVLRHFLVLELLHQERGLWARGAEQFLSWESVAEGGGWKTSLLQQTLTAGRVP
jgi:hypothetical protein